MYIQNKVGEIETNIKYVYIIHSNTFKKYIIGVPICTINICTYCIYIHILNVTQ